jgi:hypothetical protein
MLRIDSAIEGAPFFIEWRTDAAHPSQNSPSGCRLTSFAIEHPDPEQIGRVLRSLGAEGEAIITPGSRVRMKARLQTPKGEIELG